MRWVIRIGGALVLSLAAGFWWLFMDGHVPAQAAGEFDLEAYRALTRDDPAGTLAKSLNIETVSTSHVPSFATETRNFSGKVRLAMTSLQIVYEDSSIVIGGSVDQAYASSATGSDLASFDMAAYNHIVLAMASADQVLITHEHPDHVMAIIHYPDPDVLAPRLHLTTDQLAALPAISPDGTLAPEIAGIEPLVLDEPARIAPGLVAVPTPGHSTGSVSYYLRTADGTEYLLIGDIVWLMSNIEHLRSRPRLVNVLIGLDEDRPAVHRQVRALHDLMASEPDLVVIPNHDADYLEGLIAGGQLTEGFVLTE